MSDSDCSNGWVRLNIGGKLFQTTKQTLSREPDSFLARLVEDDQELPTAKDETGAYLIDRNPKLFGHLLDYLRNGTLKVHEGTHLEDLQEEAEFYNLGGLCELLKKAPERPTRKYAEVILIKYDEAQRCCDFIMSDTSEGYHILDELRSGTRRIALMGSDGHYRAARVYPTDFQQIWVKTLAVLYTYGFKLDREERVQWTFVRLVTGA
ncbi:BTB/POZ domain-containing protein KCTD17 [Aphelenchoides avenae]|nr:BTB/POZ domain-containing protein KCTD17 [Aphelenchus avenae]